MNGTRRLPQARKDGLVIRNLDDETLVFDTERGEAHCLNHTAALVWAQCDGKTTIAQAARLLQNKLDARVDADFVWLAVKQLQRFHLAEKSSKSLSVSRRALVLKYAPAALALPVIMSITAPTPAGTTSCLPNCATCGQGLPPCCSNSCDGICFPCAA